MSCLKWLGRAVGWRRTRPLLLLLLLASLCHIIFVWIPRFHARFPLALGALTIDVAPRTGERRPASNAGSVPGGRGSDDGDESGVYCMVPFIWTPKAFGTYRDIRDTWGKRCRVLRFFVDPIIGDETVGYHNMTEEAGVLSAREANLTLPDDAVVLHDMKRPWNRCVTPRMEERRKDFGNCRNIFEKVWRMVVHVANHEIDSAEWFVKVDADTFLLPDNVARYVQSSEWTHDEHHYFGHVLYHRKKKRGVALVAGGAVFFSRATLLAAADAFQKMPMDKGNTEEDGTCRDAYTGSEEVVTAVCLKEHSNVTAEQAIDSQGREGVMLFRFDAMMTMNRTAQTAQGDTWFWKDKPRYPCHDGGDCMMYLPLAFHGFEDSSFFFHIEKEFYGSVANGLEEDQTLVKKGDGRVAARHWSNFNLTHQYLERVREAMRRHSEGGEHEQQSDLHKR